MAMSRSIACDRPEPRHLISTTGQQHPDVRRAPCHAANSHLRLLFRADLPEHTYLNHGVTYSHERIAGVSRTWRTSFGPASPPHAI